LSLGGFTHMHKTAKRRFIGQCYIGQHARKSDYVLLQFRDSVMVSPTVHISKEEMSQRGLPSVIRYLRDGPASECTPISFKDPATKKDMLKLKREHALVSVELSESDLCEMKLIPLHAGHGWAFDAHADEVRTLPLPGTNDGFLKILGEALEVAT
jgi:hypothetical protein